MLTTHQPIQPTSGWPFGELTPLQQRWLAQQRTAMADRRAAPWPLGLPAHARPLAQFGSAT